MKENTVITEIEQLTPKRLTQIFKNKGYLSNGKVTKIIKKKSKETLTSHMHFLKLYFSTDAQTEQPSPEIILKLPKHDDEFRRMGRQEAQFYSIVTESNVELPIPTCYDAVLSEETGLSHIILENISKNYESHGPLSDFPASKRLFEKAIDSLAEIHAFWWDHKNLKELSKQSRGPISLFLTIVKKRCSRVF